jgi:multicomponent Na+:H+ antiporter subunit B
MRSLILRTATLFMLPLLLLFSVFLLLRGHHEPGGGFAGGLVGTAAFMLYALAFGVDAARQALGIPPRLLTGIGLLMALLTAAFPLLFQRPLLTSQGFWRELPIFELGTLDLGTPLFFDLGVYLTVLGVTLTILLSLAEE